MTPEKPVPESDLNILGKPLKICNCKPITGWFRDGFCRSDLTDLGQHTVCCVLTDQFLSYSKAQGNDLSTPLPEFGFPGLKPGDHWCVCALRWKQAYEDGMAPQVDLEATSRCDVNLSMLDELLEHAYKPL